MKRFFKSRIAAIVLTVAVSVAAVQCGYILHPEREGQKGGDIDVPILIMDCAWLIVGIIPGVIALGVDFYTGCIYKPGTTTKAEPGDSLGLRLQGDAPLPAEVSVTITSSSRDYETTLFTRSIDKGYSSKAPYIFKLPENLEKGQYELSINVNGMTNAAWPLQVN